MIFLQVRADARRGGEALAAVVAERETWTTAEARTRRAHGALTAMNELARAKLKRSPLRKPTSNPRSPASPKRRSPRNPRRRAKQRPEEPAPLPPSSTAAPPPPDMRELVYRLHAHEAARGRNYARTAEVLGNARAMLRRRGRGDEVKALGLDDAYAAVGLDLAAYEAEASIVAAAPRAPPAPAPAEVEPEGEAPEPARARQSVCRLVREPSFSALEHDLLSSTKRDLAALEEDAEDDADMFDLDEGDEDAGDDAPPPLPGPSLPKGLSFLNARL